MAGKQHGKRQQRIAAALEEIRKANGGRLTAKAVVAAARRKGHPLYREFQWDVKKAAYQTWLRRAQELITTVTIVVTHKPQEVSCVYYVRDPRLPAREPGYTAVNSADFALTDARNILADEMSRIVGGIERARNIAEELGKRFPSIPERLEKLLEDAVGLEEDIGLKKKAA